MSSPVTPERATLVNAVGDASEISSSFDSSTLLDVHPGVAIPRIVRAWGPLNSWSSAEASGVARHDGFRLEIEAAFNQSLGHYQLRSFCIVAPEDEEVTGTLLRTVTPLGAMRWLLPRTFQFEASMLSVPVADFVTPERKPHRTDEPCVGSTGIALTDVGSVYRLATIVRYPPAKAVAETFGLQTRTATNWIARARVMGLT